jgi:hypothetical protein
MIDKQPLSDGCHGLSGQTGVEENRQEIAVT